MGIHLDVPMSLVTICIDSRSRFHECYLSLIIGGLFVDVDSEAREVLVLVLELWRTRKSGGGQLLQPEFVPDEVIAGRKGRLINCRPTNTTFFAP